METTSSWMSPVEGPVVEGPVVEGPVVDGLVVSTLGSDELRAGSWTGSTFDEVTSLRRSSSAVSPQAPASKSTPAKKKR